MKTVASVMIIGGLAAAGAVHAQDMDDMNASPMSDSAYETLTTSSTDTTNGVTTNVQTQYVSTTSVMPMPDDAAPMATDAAPMASDSTMMATTVQVRLQDGTMITVPDSADAPWNKDSRLSGYNRFTFDPVSGAFVAGMGDEQFVSNWDENGNRIVKKAEPKKAVVKKVKAKKVVVKTKPAAEATTDAAPAEPEAAADEAMPDTTGQTVTETVSQTVVETPAGKTTSTAVTVTSSSTPATDAQ